MGALISRAQIDSVKATLGGVKSNAQALAALKTTQKTGNKLADILKGGGGAFRYQAAKDIKQATDALSQFEKPLSGSGTSPVGATWTAAKDKIFYTWMFIYLLQNNVPPEGDLGDGFGPALSEALKELPETIGKAAKVAVKTVVAVAKPLVAGAAEITGSVAWGLVKTAWPLLLILGVGAVGYTILRKRIPLP